MRPDRRGFTLLELLVTVVLLGIVIGLALRPRRAAQQSAISGMLRNAAMAQSDAVTAAAVISGSFVATLPASPLPAGVTIGPGTALTATGGTIEVRAATGERCTVVVGTAALASGRRIDCVLP